MYSASGTSLVCSSLNIGNVKNDRGKWLDGLKAYDKRTCHCSHSQEARCFRICSSFIVNFPVQVKKSTLP